MESVYARAKSTLICCMNHKIHMIKLKVHLQCKKTPLDTLETQVNPS